MVIQTSCRHCRQDIEGSAPFEEWRDRGNNTHCPTPAGDAGQLHAPIADTPVLRGITVSACAGMRGKLWPNGLGFNRGGWEFVYQEHRQRWSAAYKGSSNTYWGTGPTPQTAQAFARHRHRDPHCTCNDCIAEMQDTVDPYNRL